MAKRRISPARLKQLWASHTQFQTGQNAESTIKRDFRKIERILEKMPSHLGTAIEIRDWLMEHYAAESVRRIIQQFNACCTFAVYSDVIPSNPFEGVGYGLRRKVTDRNWVGFTAEERDRIIAAIAEIHPFYLPWVRFLFYTGCRPEEAAALQWRHIPPDCSQILFREARPVDVKVRQPTKNKTSRIFPCNQRLQQLLYSLESPESNAEDPVFCGKKGGHFEYHNFQTRQWKPTLENLVAEGQVAMYLPQYNCRHTFINMALDAGLTVAEVAYLVGNSPSIIYKHYLSRPRNLNVPEF